MTWKLLPKAEQYKDVFASLDHIFALDGKKITYDPISDLIFYPHQGKNFYIKRYYSVGKGIRGFRIRPRVQAEWENTLLFEQWGIPTEEIIAYGQETFLAYFKRGAFISLELPKTRDLAEMAHRKSPLLNDKAWLKSVGEQVARYTRIMHQNKFAHNDLKWRNILVDDAGKVFFIDCPTGRFWFGPFLQYRIIKDLACLDKVAKKVLSRTDRLRFYMQYQQIQKLGATDKKQIKKILGFFKK